MATPVQHLLSNARADYASSYSGCVSCFCWSPNLEQRPRRRLGFVLATNHLLLQLRSVRGERADVPPFPDCDDVASPRVPLLRLPLSTDVPKAPLQPSGRTRT